MVSLANLLRLGKIGIIRSYGEISFFFHDSNLDNLISLIHH